MIETVQQPPRRVFSRRVLLAGFGLAVLLGAGLVSNWERIRRGLLVRNIRQHFHYLQLEQADIEQFITDFEAQLHPLRRNPLLMFSKLPSHAYLSFLASTDFFSSGEDESRPVHYVALWAPRLAACHNPFTKRLLPPGVHNPLEHVDAR